MLARGLARRLLLRARFLLFGFKGTAGVRVRMRMRMSGDVGDGVPRMKDGVQVQIECSVERARHHRSGAEKRVKARTGG